MSPYLPQVPPPVVHGTKQKPGIGFGGAGCESGMHFMPFGLSCEQLPSLNVQAFVHVLATDVPMAPHLSPFGQVVIAAFGSHASEPAVGFGTHAPAMHCSVGRHVG